MEKKAKSYAFRSSGKISSLTKLIVALIFAALVIFPLIRMFLFIDGQSLSKVFSGPTFLTSLKNSLLVALTATAITIVIAYFLALCIERSRVKFKGIFSIILILPMLIPSISHGMGLVVLLGNNGVLTRLFHLDFNIYGFGGIVAGSVMYAFPVAFLMIKDVLRYENKAVYEAADILGIPKYRQFFSIGLPYLRKPLISVIFAVFTLIVTDYGVPLMVGGKFSTIPVIMYQEVIGQLDFGRGAVYGVVLLIPAVIAFIFDLINKDKANSAFVIQKFEGSKNKLVNGASYIFLIVMSLCVLLPIISFIILGFAKLPFGYDVYARKYHKNAGYECRSISLKFGCNRARRFSNRRHAFIYYGILYGEDEDGVYEVATPDCDNVRRRSWNRTRSFICNRI